MINVTKESAPVENGERKTENREGVTDAAKPMRGLPHGILSSVSISGPIDIKSVKGLETRKVEELTQKRLEELWEELAANSKDEPKLYELLCDKRVELKNNNLFNVWVPNLYLDNVFRQYQDKILSFLRGRTGNEALLYKVVVEVEKRETQAYMPREKFDEMAKRNPEMYKLRKLFPDIDF
ncbi:MAG: hypothetical protein J5848_05100 [Bacteroidales bacterium]|nr:hypothetical protein [Bacteroidales bacterium]